VNGYRIIAKKIDPELAHLFGKLPRLPYGVCVIPEFKAPSRRQRITNRVHRARVGRAAIS